MTLDQTHPSVSFDIVTRLRDHLRAHHRRNAIYRKTVNELSGLSNRELADIGISRAQIDEIAREAARKAV